MNSEILHESSLYWREANEAASKNSAMGVFFSDMESAHTEIYVYNDRITSWIRLKYRYLYIYRLCRSCYGSSSYRGHFLSKTSTLSQEHLFVSRKWMLLPLHSLYFKCYLYKQIYMYIYIYIVCEVLCPSFVSRYGYDINCCHFARDWDMDKK